MLREELLKTLAQLYWLNCQDYSKCHLINDYWQLAFME